jgi:nucleoid DNA-binding protein
MKIYYCLANNPEGIEIVPHSLSRTRQGKYWVPDCADYQTKFNLPQRLKAKEVFAGWSCYNCKFLKETSSPKEELPAKIITPKKSTPKKTSLETLTRQMLSKQISDTLEIPQSQADTIIAQTFATMMQCLSEHEPVNIQGFGNFEIRSRKSRKSRHPTTGEEVQINDGFTIRFRPGKKMKELIANFPEKSVP